MKRTPLISALSTLALAWVAVGCGTMKIPQYSGGPAPGSRTRESQGLVITAEPWTDHARLETYFKTDPRDLSTALICLRAENRSTDAAWLVSEENIHLVDSTGSGGADARNQEVKGDYGAANAVGWTGAILVSPAMIFAAGKLTSDAMVRQKNFVDREWRNQTLSPGQSAEGFIYFNVGKTTNWAGATSLRFDSLNTRTQQTNTLILPLAHENK